MFLKNKLRHFLGQFVTKIGATEKMKSAYLYYAFSVIAQFPAHSISNVWIRRSYLTSDFTPFWSDIDLTVLINSSGLKKLIESPPRDHYPLIDIQYLHEDFFENWKNTIGIRGKICSEWKSIYGSTNLLLPHQEVDKNFLALEVAYELYLLYQQLELLLFKDDIFSLKAKTKLQKDLYALREFWITKDRSWLLKRRSDIEMSTDLFEFLNDYNKFIQDIILALPDDFERYDMSPLKDEKTKWGETLFLKINNKKVHAINNYSDLKKNPDTSFFFATLPFIQLIKTVGIQEQEQLNRYVSKSGNTLFFEFCIQRLAHDLLGAVLTTKRSETTIYFALKNINDFSIQIQNTGAPFWENISQRYNHQQSISSNSKELADITQAQLDLLLALR